MKNTNKNILLLSPFFKPENFKVNDLVNYLDESGKYSVTVLCPIPNYPKGKYYKGYGVFQKRFEKNKNLTIIRILVWPRKNGSKINIFLNYLSFIIFSILPAIFLSFKKFDLIIVNQVSPITIAIPGIIIKKIKKIPMIMWVKDLWPESVKDGGNLKSNFLPNLLLPMVKFIYKNCDKILVSSRSFIDSIKEKTDNKDIIYMPHWGETVFTESESTTFKNTEIEKIKDFKIIFAGNIGIAQDFDTIINAINKVKNYPIHLVVLGEGREKKNAMIKVKKMGLESKVSFLGFFPLKTMPYFFNEADALLISLKKSDIFAKTVPAKTQSYMALGKPILTNADGEVSNIIEESESGLIANSGNYTLLANNMLKLSQLSKKELKMMANNGKKYYEVNFNRQKILNNFEKMMDSIVNNK